MKTRIITLLVALMFGSIISFAQSEHLKFKGVPIDGTLKEFTSKLEQKGFITLSQDNNSVTMSGTFAGHHDCIAYIFRNDKIDIVSGVVLNFPALDTWNLLEGQYKGTKDMLIEKYGEPFECIEEFQSRIQPTTDRDKMFELRMERCTYKTTFFTPSGRIIISLAKQSYTNYCVQLMYIDNINSDIARQSIIEDL